ncbi:MAG: TetR/AcrR family transcriptional regulator [Gammaproteobacteria bacterium]|nr:TetR/AcrR family transcriptional regulator [Gammaproteobacteria bacterium]
MLYQISKGYIVDLVDQAALAMNERDPRQRIRLLGRHLILTIASHQSELTVCFREVHSLTAERRTEVMALHADYERVWRDTMVEGAEAYCFRPFDPIVHKGILGMYYYSYLWMHLGGSLSAESIAERFNHLALRMLAPDASLARHEDRS